MKHGIPALAYSITEKQKVRINKAKLKKLKIKDGKLLAKLAQGKNIKLGKKIIKASSITYKTTPKKIAIIMDTAINSNCHKIAKGADTILSEAVYINKEKDLAALHEHLTAEQAGTIAKKAGAKQLFLSHLSQRYDCNEHLILKEAKKKFKNTKIAEDLMKIKG
jgi:ribonuclease Z